MEPSPRLMSIAAAIALAGCLGDGAAPTLTILDQGAFPTFAHLKPVFENQTGAKVRLVDGGDAGGALRTALLSAGTPVADVLYGVDNALFFSEGVSEKRLYEPYESPLLARINRTLIDVDQFRVDGELWTTPVDHGYISVNYDVRITKDTPPPATLRELASPDWAPRFVTEDPRESSPGLGFLLATIDTFGEQGTYTWKDYWREFFANGGLVVRDWSTAYVYHFSAGYGQYDAGNQGDKELVVSYTTSPAAEVFFSGGAVTEPPSGSIEPPFGVFHQIETMGILRGAAQPGLARQWIDLVLSDAYQARVLGDNAVYPVVDGMEPPQAYADFATPPSDLAPARLTAPQISANLEGWLEEWTAIYQASTA